MSDDSLLSDHSYEGSEIRSFMRRVGAGLDEDALDDIENEAIHSYEAMYNPLVMPIDENGEEFPVNPGGSPYLLGPMHTHPDSYILIKE
jgi:hypothetical protein